MDLKLLFSIIATAIGVAAIFPYLRDTFSRRTKPHPYTWLIWGITQGTAVAGIWHGGGGWGVLSLTVGTILAIIIFLVSLKYGTRNITKSDTVVLIAAFLAIGVWWQLDQPLISVIMVSAIDVLGYIPSFRKSYHEPWSEYLVAWIAWCATGVFAILALGEYNLLTTTYLITITVANLLFLLFCVYRRQFVPKP